MCMFTMDKPNHILACAPLEPSLSFIDEMVTQILWTLFVQFVETILHIIHGKMQPNNEDQGSLPGKPGILSFTFPGLENAWNLLKK